MTLPLPKAYTSLMTTEKGVYQNDSHSDTPAPQNLQSIR